MRRQVPGTEDREADGLPRRRPPPRASARRELRVRRLPGRARVEVARSEPARRRRRETGEVEPRRAKSGLPVRRGRGVADACSSTCGGTAASSGAFPGRPRESTIPETREAGRSVGVPGARNGVLGHQGKRDSGVPVDEGYGVPRTRLRHQPVEWSRGPIQERTGRSHQDASSAGFGCSRSCG